MKGLRPILLSVLLVSALPSGPPAQAGGTEDEAYEHNRQGMIAMSQAEFEEAIEKFQKAAALVQDYQIQGRELVYTPVFMTAWAYEKLGNLLAACQAYRQFLEIAPPETVEPTKAEHAREYLKSHCGSS